MDDLTEPEALADPSAGVRPALRAIRKRKRRIMITAIAGGVAIAGFGVGAALALGSNGDDAASAPPSTLRRASTTSVAVGAPPEVCGRPLTSDDPLRLWVAGDSLAGSLGPSLGEQAGATGVVQPYFDSRPSSGLSTPEFFDWPEHSAPETTRLSPEIVVFIIGANDYQVPRDDDGGAWKTQYTEQIEEMLASLESDERRVYWIGAPTMQDSRKDEGAVEVNAVMQAVIAGHPDVTYFDAYTLFAGSDGKYASSLTLPSGEETRVRAGDGVHFTPEGGDLLAAKVYELIDQRCDITAQAVPGEPKVAIETEGSSQIPGTRRDPTVTAATNAPPPTAPPPTVTVESTTTTTTTTTAPPTTPPLSDPSTTPPTTACTPVPPATTC